MVGKILLVHPLGYRTDAAGADIARLANIMPPIGMAGLAAWLDRQGFQTRLVDCYARPDALSHIRQILQDEPPVFSMGRGSLNWPNPSRPPSRPWWAGRTSRP